MKTIITIFLILLAALVFGQNNISGDSLAVIKLEYSTETFDYNLLLSSPSANKRPTVLYTLATNKFEYSTGQNNLWISFKVPANFDPLSTSHWSCDIDNKGKPEIIISGDIKKCNSIEKVLFIFNIDSIPQQIFKVVYACEKIEATTTEKITEDTTALRIINVTSDNISISPFDKKQHSFECCRLTEIPEGIYKMKNGRIRKTK